MDLGASERGIALVITLILLAIITFLAITLLVVTRSEKGTVGVKADQTTAALAADVALERVKLEVLAPIIAFTNPNNYELLVSTNYVNPLGFFATLPPNGNPYTNVNYERTSAGAALTPAQMLQNLQNLIFDPRPPVFMTNRLAGPAGSNEFRYYRDENRNGQFDATGLLPVVGLNGSYFDTNGNSFPTPVPGVVSNNFVGDPQWVGVLERPGLPHSSSNRFVSRYAFEAVPLSKTLDINFIHNYAKALPPVNMGPGNDSFFRNMGVGTWEINFAAFLVDLNTNIWQPKSALYTYYWATNNYLVHNTGLAFEDALSLLRYRYSANWANSLLSVRTLFGPNGVAAFPRDGFDGYTHGPVMVGTTWQAPPDNDNKLLNNGWPGADNPNHIFAIQDLFDRTKMAINVPAGVSNFTDRLIAASASSNSYDRYTMSRLFAQLGADSAPESGKINLNYTNVDSSGNIVPNLSTNFGVWNPAQFFTNVAVRLLANAGYSIGAKTKAVPYSSTNLLVTDGATTSFSIQIWPTNFYTPSVHRLLQVAANLYDATTNRTDTTYPHLPSVFRPNFFYDNKRDQIFITGYREVTDLRQGDNSSVLRMPHDPSVFAERRTLVANDMVLGIPLIIGAKKGFPNFNELEMSTSLSVTRKLNFRRPTATSPVNETNQMYIVGIPHVFGVEAWNSYRTNFPRPLTMIATVDMSAQLTNELAGPLPLFFTNLPTFGNTNIISQWRGFDKNHAASSFVIPLDPSSNHFAFMQSAQYSQKSHTFVSLTQEFERNQSPRFAVPHWWLTLKTRLRFVLVDTSDTGAQRVVDYVNLSSIGDPMYPIDVNQWLSRDAACSDTYNIPTQVPDGLFWCTNQTSTAVPSHGTRLQIDVSLGHGQPDWTKSQTVLPPGVSDVNAAIQVFKGNMGTDPSLYTTNDFQTPYNPARTLYILTSWQVNDPLVHYTTGDLLGVEMLTLTNRIQPNPTMAQTKIANIRAVNSRYEPWGGIAAPKPNAFTVTNIAIKDPLVTSSDDWDFPTNKFPNSGWMGRVHRGTPWQTVYLKSPVVDSHGWPNPVLTTNYSWSTIRPFVDLTVWSNWVGNGQIIVNRGQFDTNIFPLAVAPTNFATTNWTYDALLTHPANDWALLDMFTTALNDNATRGRLSVNQTNLASWSAVLSGVIALNGDPKGRFIAPGTNFAPVVIEPVGLNGTNSPLLRIVKAINDVRSTNFAGSFRKMGDILAVPELTVKSPFLNVTNDTQATWGVNDSVCERIPQQIAGLLALDPPRFLVFAYGQALKPAPRSIVTSGPFFNMCTNYQVTAEAATRTVFRVDGLNERPPNPRVVIEKFSALPPD